MNFLSFIGISIILQMMHNETVTADCILTLEEHEITKHLPIYLINRGNKYKLAIFEKNDSNAIELTFTPRNHIKVACSNIVNSENIFLEQYTILCNGDSLLFLDNDENEVDRLEVTQCTLESKASIVSGGKSCYGAGSLREVGFYVRLVDRSPIVTGFIDKKSDLIEVLSEQDPGISTYEEYIPPKKIEPFQQPESTVYAHYILFGSVLGKGATADYSVLQKYDENLKTKFLANPPKKYDLGESTTSTKKSKKELIKVNYNEETYLTFKLLVPPFEMPSYGYSLSTLYKINAFGIWSTIESYWSSLEKKIEELAFAREINLSIFTGRFKGQDELTYLWKIVHYKHAVKNANDLKLKHKGIAFFVKNEPDMSPFPKSGHFCEHESAKFCTDNGWDLEGLEITHCCPVKSLITSLLFANIEELKIDENIEVLNYSQEMQNTQEKYINFDERNFLVIHEPETTATQTEVTIPSKSDAYLGN